MTLRILPSAQEDLVQGIAFYEHQQPGVGSYFLESLSSDIISLKTSAGSHRKVFGFHRLLSKRFPYAVYYSYTPEEVLIRAVLDCRRKPRRIGQELRKRQKE